MRVVIDTNSIISALIKNNLSRKIIFNKNFEFFAPDHIISEIYRHKEEIQNKAKITPEEFEIVISLIFENITIIPKEEYNKYFDIAKNLISDLDDCPFIALCLAINAEAIWTEDTHFQSKDKIKILRTSDMLKYINY
ncbi:MAG: putative toxin-antitoxin system toxin component, PIN family [Nanoarchaeota archaeon]